MKYTFVPRYPGYLTQAEAAYASGVGDPYQFSIILRQYRGPIEWTNAEDLFPEKAKGLYDEIVSEADFATLNQWVQDTGLPMEREHKRKADAARDRVHAEYGYKLGEARRHGSTIPEPQTEADYNLYRQAFPLPEGGEYTAEWEAKLDVKRGAKQRSIYLQNARALVSARESGVDGAERNLAQLETRQEPEKYLAMARDLLKTSRELLDAARQALADLNGEKANG